MSAMETVGGTEISTFGLKLSKFDGHLSRPAYKDILEINTLAADLRILEEQNVDVELIGQFATKTALNTGVSGLQTLIKTAIKLEWYFGNYGFTETCVAKKGMSVNIYRGNIALCKFTLTITSAT